MLQVTTLDSPGTVIPIRFQDLRSLDNGSVLLRLREGQRVMVQAELDLQPPGADAAAVYTVQVAPFARNLGSQAGPEYLPLGPALGLAGVHNRREHVLGMFGGLAAGDYEVGLAGLGYPDDTSFVTVHRIRLIVTVLAPAAVP